MKMIYEDGELKNKRWNNSLQIICNSYSNIKALWTLDMVTTSESRKCCHRTKYEVTNTQCNYYVTAI